MRQATLIYLAVLFLAASISPHALWGQAGPCAQGLTPQCNDDQTITTSATSVTVNSNGGLNASFSYSIAGSPDTVSIVVTGCTKPGICSAALDTYTTVANTIRSLNLTVPYNYFTITASWTGGSGVSVAIHTNITTAKGVTPGIPSGSAGGDLGGSYPDPSVAGINGFVVPAGPAIAALNASSQLTKVTGSYTNSTSGEVAANSYGNAGYTADTSYTAGLLGCPTSSGKIGNCASGTNPPVVGVLLAKIGSLANFITSGPATVTFNATTAVTYGDFICVDASHAGDVTDSGSTPCTTKQIGIVVTSAATATTQSIFVQLGKN